MPNLLHVRNSGMLVEHSQDHGRARQLNSSCLPTSTLDNSDRKEAAHAWCNVVDKYKHEICNAVGLLTREGLHHRARNTRFCNSVSQQWRSARDKARGPRFRSQLCTLHARTRTSAKKIMTVAKCMTTR